MRGEGIVTRFDPARGGEVVGDDGQRFDFRPCDVAGAVQRGDRVSFYVEPVRWPVARAVRLVPVRKTDDAA